VKLREYTVSQKKYPWHFWL